MSLLKNKNSTEICIRCGASVAPGDDGYEDRFVDTNTPEVRIDHGCLYPYGDCVCWECQSRCPITELEHSRHPQVIGRLTKLMRKGGIIPKGKKSKKQRGRITTLHEGRSHG